MASRVCERDHLDDGSRAENLRSPKNVGCKSLEKHIPKQPGRIIVAPIRVDNYSCIWKRHHSSSTWQRTYKRPHFLTTSYNHREQYHDTSAYRWASIIILSVSLVISHCTSVPLHPVVIILSNILKLFSIMYAHGKLLPRLNVENEQNHIYVYACIKLNFTKNFLEELCLFLFFSLILSHI